MELQTEPLKEVLGELFALLETQETQGVAILQFLKDQGIATEEKLAPYLEQAGNASSVKWRAARRRMEYLLTPIQEDATVGAKEAAVHKAQETEQEKTEAATAASADSKEANRLQRAEKAGDVEKQSTERAATAKAAPGSRPSGSGDAASENTREPAGPAL